VPSSRSVAVRVGRLLQLVLLGLDFVQSLGIASIFELLLGLLDLASQISHILDQVHVLLHNVKVVFTVKSGHLLQLV